MKAHKENIRPLIEKVSDNAFDNKITTATADYKLINNKIDEMLLTMYEEEIDICMLTETWIKDETTLDKLEQMGHKFLQVYRLERPGGNKSTFQQLPGHNGTRQRTL